MTDNTPRPNNRNQVPIDEIVEDDRIDSEEAETLLDGAEDAVNDMVARERRRDQTYRISGDDLDPGIDEQIDSNAPKELQLPPRKRSENQT